MTWEKFKERYNRAYDKQLQKLNVMTERYTESELLEAFNTYCDHSVWFYRAFKPATLAQSNVVYYDFQIRQVFPDTDDAVLYKMIRNNPVQAKKIVDEYFKMC